MQNERIQEWTENPVTLELRKNFEGALEDLLSRGFTEFFAPNDPQKTQENLVWRTGYIEALSDVIDALSGDWEMFEEEESEDE